MRGGARAFGSAGSWLRSLPDVRGARVSHAATGRGACDGMRLEAARIAGGRLRRTAGTASGTGARTIDDGTPLGSAANDECHIDAIAQSLVSHFRGWRCR